MDLLRGPSVNACAGLAKGVAGFVDDSRSPPCEDRRGLRDIFSLFLPAVHLPSQLVDPSASYLPSVEPSIQEQGVRRISEGLQGFPLAHS